MTAEVISIGTELLLGQIVDTDAAYLAQELSKLGVNVYHRATVGDNLGRAIETVGRAYDRSDLVFLIGGLGPTMDDLTRDVMASVADAPLVRDAAIEAHLRDWFARRNYTASDTIFRQADVPTGARPLPNPNGTAPGLLLEKNGKIIIALPGPPSEFVPMVDAQVVPLLQERLGGERQVIRSRTLRFVGIGESNVEEAVRDLMLDSNPSVAPYAKPAEVHLRVTARAASEVDADRIIGERVEQIRARVGQHIYGEDDTSLEEAVVGLLRAAKKTVATAESCTGGLLSGRITSVPGSSDVFGTGLVTYSNETKQKLLQIPHALIASVGAVSPEVACAMAERVRELSGANFGIGITGVAGPGGGTDAKPVGLVYVAVSDAGGVKSTRNLYSGGRGEIRHRATQTALQLLREKLVSGA